MFMFSQRVSKLKIPSIDHDKGKRRICAALYCKLRKRAGNYVTNLTNKTQEAGHVQLKTVEDHREVDLQLSCRKLTFTGNEAGLVNQ